MTRLFIQLIKVKKQKQLNFIVQNYHSICIVSYSSFDGISSAKGIKLKQNVKIVDWSNKTAFYRDLLSLISYQYDLFYKNDCFPILFALEFPNLK